MPNHPNETARDVDDPRLWPIEHSCFHHTELPPVLYRYAEKSYDELTGERQYERLSQEWLSPYTDTKISSEVPS